MDSRTSQDYKNYYDILGEPIGIGAFGCVYKGKVKGTKNEFRAIKVINLDNIRDNLSLEYDPEEMEKSLKNNILSYINEFDNMNTCSNNNINSVKCYEYFNNEKSFAFVMELCDKSLAKLFQDRIRLTNKGFNDEEIYVIMKQLNNTFKIMKENNIIHRDLKFENILLKYNDDKNFTVKLSDYGSSKRLNSLSRNYCNTNTGTLIYMAPEILLGEKHNYKCDLWSIGIIIFRLKFGKPPFYGDTEIALIQKINSFRIESFKSSGNKILDDLIKNLLQKDPSKRFDWTQYFNHPFFEDKTRNEIKIIYESETISNQNIFGKQFVENNKNNIELIINGEKTKLVKKYKLKKGLNNIQIIIKNKLNNLENMFYECKNLKNIDELKYLDIKGVNNFSEMFSGCTSLTDIKSLQNWDVSNINNFSDMLSYCTSLNNIKALKNWNVSNGNNFSYMFAECSSLLDLEPIQDWDVSNGNNFCYMFVGCSSLTDLKPLQNWNVSNGNDLSGMFGRCSKLTDIKTLWRWDVSNNNNFSYMFYGCSSLSDIKSLQNWNVLNGNDFSDMFLICSSLADIKALQNWNVSNGIDFSSMFEGCSLLTDIKPIQNWKVSNDNNFLRMFEGCSSLTDKKPLQIWNLSENQFKRLF